MKARKNLRKESEELRTYLAQINHDGMFFKGQKILGGLLVGILLTYFMWMAYFNEVIGAIL